MKAEALWTMYCVENHISYSANDNSTKVFRRMFHTCDIAHGYQCGPNKMSYIVNFGLAPYFADLLRCSVGTKNFVLLFDESLNRITRNKYGFSVEFFRRFLKIQKIIFPSFKCVTVLLFVALLCMQILEQVLVYNVGLLASGYYQVLGDRNLVGFISHTLYAMLLVVAIAVVKGTSLYISSVFYVCSRQRVTSHLHRAYFRDVLYYHVNVTDAFVDNPDQRITQDVDTMLKNYSDIVGLLLLSPFTISYYTYKTWQNTGYIGPLCVVLFFIVSSGVNKCLMSPVVLLVHEKQRLEGHFRYKHMQIRTNCESAAFFRAGRVEMKKTDAKLKRLIGTQHRLVFKEFFLQISINLADYFGSILSYIILAIPIFGGKYDGLSPSEIASLISANAFVIMYLINCFTQLLDLSVTLSDIAGTTHRVAVLSERLEELSSRQLLDASSSIDSLEITCVAGDSERSPLSPELVASTTILEPINVAYRLEGATYGPPNSDQALVTDLDLQIVVGLNLLVTGDSGCGKSSLLRVLDGLWPLYSGNLDRQVRHGRHGVIFLPQKPFLTDGSLRDQIIYPKEDIPANAISDDELKEFLRLMDLFHLLTRVGSLDNPVQWNWYDVLSPGEMQRLSFVRLFFHRPPLAVLDEATSQVGEDMETTAYETCAKLRITVISIGHRASLRRFHDRELRLRSASSGSSWTIQDLHS